MVRKCKEWERERERRLLLVEFLLNVTTGTGLSCFSISAPIITGMITPLQNTTWTWQTNWQSSTRKDEGLCKSSKIMMMHTYRKSTVSIPVVTGYWLPTPSIYRTFRFKHSCVTSRLASTAGHRRSSMKPWWLADNYRWTVEEAMTDRFVLLVYSPKSSHQSMHLIRNAWRWYS